MPDNPDHSGVRTRFGALIGLAARQWRRAVDTRLQAFGLTDATWLPLLRLAQAEKPMRQKDLAAVLLLDTSSVVRILSNLETAGLIEQKPDEDDRRAKAITVTEAGRALVAKVESASSDVEDVVLDGLSPDDVAVARRVMEEVCRRLLDQNETGGKS